MKKKVINKTFICISMLVCSLFFTSCIRKKQDNGKLMTKEIKVIPFQDLKLLGNSTVYIIPGDTFKVVVKGKEKFLKEMNIKVEKGTLIISESDHRSIRKGDLQFGVFNAQDYRAAVYVTMPALRNVVSEANASLYVEKPMQGDSVTFDIEGNSSVDITGLTAKTLQMGIEGNASTSMMGITTERTNIGVVGNASVDIDFKYADNAQTEINGNASVTLKGTTKAKPVYTLSGNGSVNDYTQRSQKK